MRQITLRIGKPVVFVLIAEVVRNKRVAVRSLFDLSALKFFVVLLLFVSASSLTLHFQIDLLATLIDDS